ncbi:MAG: hypothetical protein ACOYB3_09845 [Azonexus sp.]|jgi:hypothetical protein
MSKTSKTNDFLAALSSDALAASTTAPSGAHDAALAAVPKTQRKQAGRKHIGGYFDRDMVEKVAVLRARLSLDNSELIKLAIEDLYRKHEAKRAFGDA